MKNNLTSREIKMRDLLHLDHLKKTDKSAEIKIILGNTATRLGETMSDVADKIESNEKVRKAEVKGSLAAWVEAIEQIRVNYFGDQLSPEEWAKISPEETEYCEDILKGNFVQHQDLTYLPIKIAEALLERKNILFLNNISKLSPELANVLARYSGKLILSGVRELTDEAAEALSRHQNELGLDNLEVLSERGAAFLANHGGDLYCPQAIEEKIDKYRQKGE